MKTRNSLVSNSSSSSFIVAVPNEKFLDKTFKFEFCLRDLVVDDRDQVFRSEYQYKVFIICYYHKFISDAENKLWRNAKENTSINKLQSERRRAFFTNELCDNYIESSNFSIDQLTQYINNHLDLKKKIDDKFSEVIEEIKLPPFSLDTDEHLLTLENIKNGKIVICGNVSDQNGHIDGALFCGGFEGIHKDINVIEEVHGY